MSNQNYLCINVGAPCADCGHTVFAHGNAKSSRCFGDGDRAAPRCPCKAFKMLKEGKVQ